MIERKITIDGVERTLRSSALLPRLYRAKFGRDMVKDLRKLAKTYTALKQVTDEEEREELQLNIDYSVFEDTAWLMLKYAGEDVCDTPEEWLESINDLFEFYRVVLPAVLDIWGTENKTTAVPRKK